MIIQLKGQSSRSWGQHIAVHLCVCVHVYENSRLMNRRVMTTCCRLTCFAVVVRCEGLSASRSCVTWWWTLENNSPTTRLNTWYEPPTSTATDESISRVITRSRLAYTHFGTNPLRSMPTSVLNFRTEVGMSFRETVNVEWTRWMWNASTREA